VGENRLDKRRKRIPENVVQRVGKERSNILLKGGLEKDPSVKGRRREEGRKGGGKEFKEED